MQDASDVMQLLLKTQTDFSDMEDDDPQVKQPSHALASFWSIAQGYIYLKKKSSNRFLVIISTRGFRDILHWFSFYLAHHFSLGPFQAAPLLTSFWFRWGSVMPGSLTSSLSLSSVIHRHSSGFPSYGCGFRSVAEFRVHLSSPSLDITMWMSPGPLHARWLPSPVKSKRNTETQQF